MDQIANAPRAVGPSIEPTFKAYMPLLVANAETIKSTRCETFSYGDHDRQTLDVYYPTNRQRSSVSSGNSPVLIFLYGGGLVRGSKSLPMTNGLAHANIGHFFAEKLGYTTIVADYRLLEHGARFPSGGEDLAKVVDWVRESLTKQEGYSAIDLFIMGNSAGGIHLSTYAFAPDFEASRAKVITSDPDASVHLRGIILLSVPFNFKKHDSSRSEILTTYFGDFETNSPQGLLRAAMLRDPDNVLTNVRAMVLNGTLDPEDEILEPKEDFLSEWQGLDEESREAVTVEMMEGHNHISPFLSLGTGIEREEKWGYQVGEFMESLRS